MSSPLPSRKTPREPTTTATSAEEYPDGRSQSVTWLQVGLTGFRCWCEDLFCSDHRYSDRQSRLQLRLEDCLSRVATINLEMKLQSPARSENEVPMDGGELETKLQSPAEGK
ncbi:hypothetical protein NE237_012838 [Protea cynaroides]|uniref:AN1-type domain-containing protein n=1 Tax=Protea cynaroides TaxID=273540 RepID=A0A9Q0GYT4_9MAGN|nr:hypothetical protein NE237_012838 [Protea cynaroides]